MKLRVGTRGSDLALAQTRLVMDALQALRPELVFEQVVIQTHGDEYLGQFGDEHWPVGGFVSAIEQALLADRIDVAVHSYKDLPTNETPGVTIAAVPQREVAHDVLVTAVPIVFEAPPDRLRIGTSSARRAAQLRRVLPKVEIVPIRGNVPTRLAKIAAMGLDGIVLAGAGLRRLQLNPPHLLPLPTDRFVPAPGQGALAVQVRSGHDASVVQPLDHPPTRRAVEAERSFLRTLGAGCQTPAAALAATDARRIYLHGQLFTPDGADMVDAVEIGTDPTEVGRQLAEHLARELLGDR